MACMIFVYRTPQDIEAFNRHYLETHLPLVKKLPGLRKYELSHGPIASPVGSCEAYMIAMLHFADLAALQNAIASEQGQACATDRRRFAPNASDVQTFLFESGDVNLGSWGDKVASKCARVEVHKSDEIPASAAEVWTLLTDWAGMLRWWLTAEQGGLPGPTLVKCELIGEQAAVPRTRRMTLDNGLVVEEQIFHQDDNSRRIYYIKSEPSGSPISGYVASAYVDDIEDHRCALHISSSFDVQMPADVEAAAARFGLIYQSIFRGFQNYFSRGPKATQRPV